MRFSFKFLFSFVSNKNFPLITFQMNERVFPVIYLFLSSNSHRSFIKNYGVIKLNVSQICDQKYDVATKIIMVKWERQKIRQDFKVQQFWLFIFQFVYSWMLEMKTIIWLWYYLYLSSIWCFSYNVFFFYYHYYFMFSFCIYRCMSNMKFPVYNELRVHFVQINYQRIN